MKKADNDGYGAFTDDAQKRRCGLFNKMYFSDRAPGRKAYVVNQYAASYVEAMMSADRENRQPVTREEFLRRLDVDLSETRARMIEIFELYVKQEAA